MTQRIGLQLYSLRDYVEEDVAGMLRKVKVCGFTAVEFAGYYGLPAEELKALVDEIGLEPYSSHVAYELIESKPEEVIAYSKALGLSYVICPFTKPATAEEAREIAEVLNHLHEQLAPFGIKVGYHNHAHEFVEVDGKYLEDYLLEGFGHEDMVAEIDTCWVRYAGVDPVAYIDKLGQQAGPIHFKELGKDFAPGSREGLDAMVGEGIIDFASILQVMQKNGTLERGVIVEQEAFQADPYAQLAESVYHIRQIWPGV